MMPEATGLVKYLSETADLEPKILLLFEVLVNDVDALGNSLRLLV